MLKFYFNGGPNPLKVALFLEEAGLRYEAIPIDPRKREQLTAGYLSVNPNGKVPAISDDGVIVFDSNAILLYLAEKTGQFLPPDSPAKRADLLSWLMFIASGLGPFCGQAVHFKHYAPQDSTYARTRYQSEAHRHFAVLDDRLAQRHYLLGDTYTIVDMDMWGWAKSLSHILGDEAGAKYPNVQRVVDGINARPPAARAIALKDRFTFKSEMDEEARRYMFGHISSGTA
jgi:GSH-dependent disulfide-bond oxidoreductase